MNSRPSVGDTLTIEYDRKARPDAAACRWMASSWPCASSGGKAFVDELVTMSHSPGRGYEGRWANAWTLVVTITDATNSSMSP